MKYYIILFVTIVCSCTHNNYMVKDYAHTISKNSIITSLDSTSVFSLRGDHWKYCNNGMDSCINFYKSSGITFMGNKSSELKNILNAMDDCDVDEIHYQKPVSLLITNYYVNSRGNLSKSQKEGYERLVFVRGNEIKFLTKKVQKDYWSKYGVCYYLGKTTITD